MNRIFKDYPKTYIEFPERFFRTRKDVSNIVGLPSREYNSWKDIVINENLKGAIAIRHVGPNCFIWDNGSYVRGYFIKYPYMEVMDYGEL